MIVSERHRYVYVGIPRTGSKSMNHWLVEHFDGESCGRHHEIEVPEEYRDFLVFTLVRNPYDLWVSFTFMAAWGEHGVKDGEVEPGGSTHEQRMKQWAVLETREKERKPIEMPDEPLEARIEKARRDTKDGGLLSNNLDTAGVQLALYFERLPQCLTQLPFVDADIVPPFYRHPERGVRPSGRFEDLFPADEEQVVQAAAHRDFDRLHYERQRWGLPDDAPDAVWLDGRDGHA